MKMGWVTLGPESFGPDGNLEKWREYRKNDDLEGMNSMDAALIRGLSERDFSDLDDRDRAALARYLVESMDAGRPDVARKALEVIALHYEGEAENWILDDDDDAGVVV